MRAEDTERDGVCQGDCEGRGLDIGQSNKINGDI